LDVADGDRPFASAAKIELHAFLVGGVGGGEEVEGLLELAIHFWIEKLGAGDGVDAHALQALRGAEVEHIDDERLGLAAGERARFDPHDDAGNDGWRFELYALATQLLKNLSERGGLGQVDGERAEGAIERFGGAVVYGGDEAAAAILHDKAFEQVVNVGCFEGEIDLTVIFDFAAMLEEANAGAEQDYALEREGVGLVWRFLGKQSCRKHEEENAGRGKRASEPVEQLTRRHARVEKGHEKTPGLKRRSKRSTDWAEVGRCASREFRGQRMADHGDADDHSLPLSAGIIVAWLVEGQIIGSPGAELIRNRTMRAALPAVFLVCALTCWLSLSAASNAQNRLVVDENTQQHERNIELALALQGSVRFQETALQDVAAELSRQFQIPIVLSPKKLEEASISQDTPVTKHLEGLSLESILGLILRDLELVFTIRHEVLLITTAEDAESDLDTRVYPVLDLITTRKAGSHFYVGRDYDSLIELIIATIKPDSWDDVGGPGAIDALDNAGSLVISQTQAVHRQVERLLVSLRRAKKMQGIPSLPVPDNVSSRASWDEKVRARGRATTEGAPGWVVPQVYR
jgi:hypothetical protein